MENRAHRRDRKGVRPRRSPLVTTFAVAGVVLLLAALLAPAIAGAEEGGESIISIEQKALPFDGDCNLFAQLQLTYTTSSNSDHFRLVVTSATKPCDPIAAAAVAYRMPTDGQWPQKLVERRDFTISAASTTTITFAKECVPFQFDVITGASPAVIAPEGPWHGPLLFPGDTGTSQQYMPPADCKPTTPTTPTVAPPASVAPATTTPTVAAETTIAPAVTVAGTVATSPGAASLALTGRSSLPLAATGVLLLLAGVGLSFWGRRSRRD